MPPQSAGYLRGTAASRCADRAVRALARAGGGHLSAWPSPRQRKPGARSRGKGGRAGPPYTLAIDIGGTHIKASVLDRTGKPVVDRVGAPTPHPAPPAATLELIRTLASALPAFDRISAGFPGVVKGGRVITAPNLGTEAWRAFPLAANLEKQLGKPARVLNDAEMQGLAVIAGLGTRMRAYLRHRHGQRALSRRTADAASGARPASGLEKQDLRSIRRRRRSEETRLGQMEPAGCAA